MIYDVKSILNMDKEIFIKTVSEKLGKKIGEVIRLTQVEYAKVKSLDNGKVFEHVNLQHKGIVLNLDPFGYRVAVSILKHGKLVGNVNIDPILDYSNCILLKEISVVDGLNVKDGYNSKDLILDNEKGVFESLCDKYVDILGLKEEEILNMKFYVRRFEVLEHIEVK